MYICDVQQKIKEEKIIILTLPCGIEFLSSSKSCV